MYLKDGILSHVEGEAKPSLETVLAGMQMEKLFVSIRLRSTSKMAGLAKACLSNTNVLLALSFGIFLKVVSNITLHLPLCTSKNHATSFEMSRKWGYAKIPTHQSGILKR
jgi:hypothetical protein